MNDLKIGDEIWIISFEIENDFYLIAKQTITELAEEHIECEDEFNTFHVSYEDVYRSEKEAITAMIERLQDLRAGL